ncbi:hypothetical protein CORC01_05579 [Colletotrichum orchidophilum]|uniref:Uncharacterized protein n=1 Tax=Colletotrichum orchidophilum TaxID=1209926 RepID=A0A1G4BCI9_9PEZI|nr:uncharacterized protein CORC01_05579 [Colletotrichum orchidophilum]OHE99087.1 hypothetical protein CORC01_05579 [Colletotrichum orchidophilum]
MKELLANSVNLEAQSESLALMGLLAKPKP